MLNIKGAQKVLFDINGKLQFIAFESNAFFRTTIDSFTEIRHEGNPSGFVYFTNGYLKICKIPKNYEISEMGLLRQNPLYRFPVICNILPMVNMQFYIMIEKENRIVTIPNMIPTMKQIYYLVLRTEE